MHGTVMFSRVLTGVMGHYASYGPLFLLLWAGVYEMPRTHAQTPGTIAVRDDPHAYMFSTLIICGGRDSKKKQGTQP